MWYEKSFVVLITIVLFVATKDLIVRNFVHLKCTLFFGNIYGDAVLKNILWFGWNNE